MASPIWTSPPNFRREIPFQQHAAVEEFQRLRAYLSSKGGDVLATVLAEPRRQSDGSIFWLDQLGAEQTSALHSLSGEARSSAEAALKKSLSAIEAVCDSTGDGGLVLSALSIENPDCIRVANGRVILAGWGAVPKRLTSPVELQNHHLATLGPFLDRVAPPLFYAAEEHVLNISPVAGGLVAATLIAATVLALLLLPGVLRGPYYGAVGVSPPVIPSVNYDDANRAIEGQIATLKRTLEGNVCQSTGAAIPRIAPPVGLAEPPPLSGGPRPGGSAAIPNVQPDGAHAESTPPVQPNTTPVPSQSMPNQPQGAQNLASFLDNATVLVITKSGSGSGFFISNQYVLTNRHVVEDSGGLYFVGNKALGQMLPAEVVGKTDNSQIGSPDFALLKLKSGSSPNFMTFASTLPFQLQNVIASGFPAVVMATDSNFEALRHGDRHAIPDNALTMGAVVVVQNAESPTPIILHRASISPGNSGGPLTDECGRVVGVNTFVAGGEGATDRMHYSLAASAAVQFLQKFNINPTVVSGACVTGPAAASEAPATPPSSTANPPPASTSPPPAKPAGPP